MEYRFSSNINFNIKNKLDLSLSDLIKDKSNLTLFLSNLFVIFLAVIYKWNFSELLWIYWSQSIIIGFFQIIKIIDLKNYSISGIKFNLSLEKPFLIKFYTLLFFFTNYAIFHLAYYFFIKYAYGLEIVDYYPIVISCFVFFINHLFSFLSNRSTDRIKRKNLGQMVNLAYIRIYPMHFTLMFGGIINQFFNNTNLYKVVLMVFFLFIKALADSISHKYEHNIEEKSK